MSSSQPDGHDAEPVAGAEPPGPGPASSAFIQTAGTKLGGYTLLSRLGQGGMGAVYKARQDGFDRLVALKVLPKRLARDQVFITRFLREARAAGKLSHPNIVAGIDAGFADGYHYFAMEYIEGRNLGERLAAEGRIPSAEAVELGRQTALALEHAHQAGIVHRDIKPENILVAADGTAKLCDLGLALNTGEDLRITQTGIAVGTPYYISPEQVSGQAADPRSDIYSLGCTLFHLISGRPPRDGKNAMEIMLKHLNEEAPALRTVWPEASPALEAVIARMTARRPEDRHQTAAEAAEDLALAASGAAPRASQPARPPTRSLPTAPPHPRTERPGRKSGPDIAVPDRRKWRAVAIWVGAAGLLAATLAFFLATGGGDLRRPGRQPDQPATGAPPVATGQPPVVTPPTTPPAVGRLRATWKQVQLTGESPGVRTQITTSMAYDSKRRRSVLFGGAGQHQGFGYSGANDLWALDLAAASWTRLEPNRPKDPAVGKALPGADTEGRHLTYVESRDVYLWSTAWAYYPDARTWKPEPKIEGNLPYAWDHLSGSAYSPDAKLFLWFRDTTILVDATTNRAQTLKGGPQYLEYATGDLTYDRRNRLFVLFHPGCRKTTAPEATWIFDPAAGAWRPAKAGTRPPNRWAHNLVAHDRLGVLVLIGGCRGYYADWLSDLWIYDAARDVWSELKPTAPAPPPGVCAAVYDASQDRIVAYVNGQVWTLALE
ncbi:MAG TPA: protein kinase [Planctomycetota bacterium]|nr:protein kinase [Planctomycetota bacterium]